MRDNRIELKPDMPGFDHFFGVWVLEEKFNLLVDAGPANSVSRLLDSLAALGVETLDYVLLTHIHIDHCGGLGRLLDRYPMARAICHESSIPHLMNPSTLWEASLKILGDIAKGYGPPRAIGREKLIPHTRVSVKGLEVIETPGHSAHHLSFNCRNRIFAGEAAGNYLIVKNEAYLRPATPPKFLLDVFIRSIDKLLELEDQPICYAHFDSGESSHLLLNRFKDQLMVWKKTIRAQMQAGEADLLNRCIHALLESDANLNAFHSLDPSTRKRERFFLKNSIKGFLGFLRD